MTAWLTRLVPAIYKRSGAARLFRLPAADPLFLAAFFSYKRLVEDPFAALAARRPELFRGGDVLDVGANAGYTSVVFARAIDPGARVEAFEPEAVNLRRLRRVIGRHRLEQVVIPHAVAAGSRDGEVALVITQGHPGDHHVAGPGEAAAMTIPVRSLDGFVDPARPIAFVKIDVQGYELEVSRGMTELLERWPEITVAFEYAPADMRRFGIESRDLIAFYLGRGFTLYLLAHDGVLTPFSEEAASGPLARRGYVDVLAVRRRASP